MSVLRFAMELGARCEALAARGVRGVSPPAYWRALAERFPPHGASIVEIGARVDLDAPWPEAATVALPDLRLVDGTLRYETHALGALRREDAVALDRFFVGIASRAEIARLVKLGLVFERPPAPRAERRAMVVSPHRDDAPLALGGILARDRARTLPFIVNLFTVSGWMGVGFEARTVPRVTALRAREDALSASILAARSVDLDLWEIDLCGFRRRALEGYALPRDFRFKHNPELRTREERRAIGALLTAVASRIEPDTLYLPLAIGGHSDHHTTLEVALEILPSLIDRWPDLDVRFYEDQPYSTYSAEAPQVIAERLRPLGRALVPELVDVTDTFEQKLQAIAAHRSQFSRAENEERLTRYAMGLGAGRLCERVYALTGR